MEKKRTAEETLIHTLINRQDEIKQGKDQPFIDMLHEYAAKETKPLKERIDELEGALKGMKSPLEVAAIAEAAYNTGSAVQEFNINHYLKHQQ